ncbi:hypothetical protein [Bifidobacterium vespertilionis]|uniref:Lactococcin 972 family bacteriocin n=2 Tax=Bifidobacterium vespertilionis TaxID=2562524 RepID=A0ABQ6STU3_9BIFI|nr:hypothetical protein [Bifidobacterium vespertilionis]KAA8821558.1 hypothetical protein EMO90_02705 [Bifidobacterium vespertilionis]
MSRKAVSATAAALAVSLTLAVGVQTAQADSGQLNNANIIAAWNWNGTRSDASSYSAKYEHYAYARQDTPTNFTVDNKIGGMHAEASVWNGNWASTEYDYAAAGLGRR